MRSFLFDRIELIALGLGLGLVLFMGGLSLVGVGCAPGTDLFVDPSTPGDDPGGGTAAGALVDPRAGSTDVPWNLAAVTVRLPLAVAVAGGDPPFRLRASAGGAADASLGPPEAADCQMAAGACYRVPVSSGLAPSLSYVFELLPGTLREDGGPAAAGVIGAFDTAADADAVAPQILDVTMTAAGGCVALRFGTDEPVDAQIVFRGDGIDLALPAGAGQTTFDLALPLSGLPPGAHVEVVVAATDRAGNAIESSAGELDVPQALPPLAITEVLANPAGPEPAQEYVELRNLGDGPVSLQGLRLEDSKNGDVLPATVLAAGAYALVVPSGYDSQSAHDVAPRAGTVLVRVDARLGSDGLSNSGELVRLRMPGTGNDPIVSSYGGWVDVSATSAAGKSVHRLTDQSCDHPSAWTVPPRVPTPGWETPP